jgi:hypothetical protein
MSVKEIREPYSAAPFRPFAMVLTNASTGYGEHPECMMFSADYRKVYAADKRDGGRNRIDVKMSIGLNELKDGARSRKRKR